MYKLTTKINGTVIKRILTNCRVPVKTKFCCSIWWSRAHYVIISSNMIKTLYVTLLTHGIAISRIYRIGNDIKPIAKANFLPVAITNSLSFPNISRTSPRTVVLHTTVYIIRILVIRCNMIKLRYRKVTYKAPSFSSVFRNI